MGTTKSREEKLKFARGFVDSYIFQFCKTFKSSTRTAKECLKIIVKGNAK